MANSFPPVPTDFALKSVVYTLNFGTTAMNVTPNLQFTGATTFLAGALTTLGDPGAVQFVFDVAGEFGSFDQAAAEQTLTDLAASVFQLMAAFTGQTVAELETNFSVTRTWNWVDDAGNSAIYTDTMPSASDDVSRATLKS
jgi:hypothetical protein